MNHLLAQLRNVVTKDLKRQEGVVLSTINGQVSVSTRRGVKTFPAGSVAYKSGEKIAYDDEMGVVGRKRSSTSSKKYKV